MTWWPLWVSMALFGLSIFFIIVGEIRTGRIVWSILLPERIRTNIRQFANSEWWVSLMMSYSDFGEAEIGDCGVRSVHNGKTSEPLHISTDTDASNLDRIDVDDNTLPFHNINVKREVKIISMRDPDHETEGAVTHNSLQTMIISRSKKRLPYAVRKVLSHSSNGKLSWNLHYHARWWPVLENVLELPRSKFDKTSKVAIPSEHVFVDEERDSSLLTFQAHTKSRRPAASRVSHVREMFTLDFLSQNEKVSETEIEARGHYYYDCNYRVYEGIVGGKKDANLLSSQDLFSWKSFAFSDIAADTVEQLRQVGVNMSVLPNPTLRLLPAGTALQLRYAESHVMRLQLTGSAQYTLFPPSALPSLALFPSGHASRWQSQVQLYDSEPQNRKEHFPFFYSWLDRSERAFKLTDDNAPQNITLFPGDILYLPPFWSVHSEAVRGMSTVIDVPSPSHEQLALMEAWYMYLPLQDPALYMKQESIELGENAGTDASAGARVEVSFLDRVVAAQVYLVHILSRCFSVHSLLQSPRHFSQRLYKSRYIMMYTPDSLFMRPYAEFLRQGVSAQSASSSSSDFMCFRGKEDEIAAAIARINATFLVSRAEFIASCVEDPAVPVGAKIVWLESFAERVAAWAMSKNIDLDSVDRPFASDRHEAGLRFLLSCLHQDHFVEVEEEGDSIRIDGNVKN